MAAPKNALLAKLLKNSTQKHTSVMSDSKLFTTETVLTDIPILNLALSGSLRSGLDSGVISVAAPSKHFKSLLSLFMVSAYMKKYPESICLFYDSEFGSPPDYLKMYDIDIDRVVHTPITTIEELKHDITVQTKGIERGDKVIIFMDSVGNLASEKETLDAEKGENKTDMTRAKALKSMFRIVTPQMKLKDIPCVVINHTYETLEMFSKTTMSGGTGIMYSSNTVIFITKAQEKDGADLAGFKFTLVTEKSRSVREKSKFPLTVTFKDGISKYSGLLDLALELGFVEKPSNGWFCRVIDGVVEDKKWRRSESDCDEFWDVLLNSDAFERACNQRYKLSKGEVNPNNIEDEVDEDEEIDLDSAEFIE